MIECDPVTGVCQIPEQDSPEEAAADIKHTGWAVHYVGDPMCSWCWGISPSVEAVEAFCASQDIEFTITMGGLRSGGGDAWNEHFKSFLRNEWQHIGQVTGQPFGFKLLEASHFDYDTEPACRAVTTVKILQGRNDLPKSIVLKFFSAIQHKFYAEGQDPKVVDFYAGICADLGLDFDEFITLFESPEAQQAVQQEFSRCRQWGVRSFPTLLLAHDGKMEVLAQGYVSAEQVLTKLREKIKV